MNKKNKIKNISNRIYFFKWFFKIEIIKLYIFEKIEFILVGEFCRFLLAFVPSILF